MGLCSSTGAPLSPEEVKSRRASLIKFRNKYKSYASSISPPSNVDLTVEVEPWIASPEGVRGVDDALATFQRGSHTSTREINFALSGMMSVDNNYDYKNSVVLSLKDKKTKDVISAALMCEHQTGGGKVMELIWFVTQRKMEDRKFGSVLFRCIRDLTRLAGAKALLITSTPQATGFWLLYLYKLKESEKFSTPVIRSRKLDKAFEKVPKDLSQRRVVHFKEMMRVHGSVTQPGADVRPFYSNSGMGGFSGKPYRYSTASTSHIWFKVLSHTSAPLLTAAKKGKVSSSGKISRGKITSSTPSNSYAASNSSSPSKAQLKE
eukprot:CAMPEP_0118641710 /NCGR_PEP_ID=MMETSP0785-20121206/5445_1 /TAXON_ID=91992 /ORGANISM="Bolidomonas pacifica, Strain CCMP 1866" /LENGTH=319 /DNA_ID=CAMNT_0006533209 /DNA_START=126 /DNA_END=1082 /DNA_ORIENTATION=+